MTDVQVPVRAFAGSPGGRVVFWSQLIALTAYLLGSYVILVAAVIHRRDPGALLRPGLERLGDPKASFPIVGPDSEWNPVVWVFGLSRALGFFVYPLSAAALLLGAAGLLRTRRRDRALFRRIAAVTAAWLVVGIVAVTPYGAHLLTWLLD
ncbi:hypothetical protein [Actinoplanes subtropicus]|uniref:hypothetical protein n=1 Tax=Actinoplanes subtropicus TaxID=543632 RepID=UPI0004C43450|nr:hypothetical protein [Actinoplanes subtropicus]